MNHSPTPATKPLRLGVLISGGGTTMLNLAEQIKHHALPATIACVISSTPRARGIQRAATIGLYAEVIRANQFADTEAYSHAIFSRMRAARIDLVCLAGFLSLIHIPADFENRVMNVHPALLPAFGGLGMYGHHVHQAVLDHGCKLSGCTVHFANNEYDAGPIILQKAVPVLETDTPDTLADRVMAAERELYPEAVRLYAAGRLQINGRKVRIESVD